MGAIAEATPACWTEIRARGASAVGDVRALLSSGTAQERGDAIRSVRALAESAGRELLESGGGAQQQQAYDEIIELIESGENNDDVYFDFGGGTGKPPVLDYQFNMINPGQPRKRKALKTMHFAWERHAVACRPSVGPGGGLDSLEGQRSGWIVCRRSHYHAGLWFTPSNEYLLES